MNIGVAGSVILYPGQMTITNAQFISSNSNIYSVSNQSEGREAVSLLCQNNKKPWLFHLFTGPLSSEISANKNHILSKSLARCQCWIGSVLRWLRHKGVRGDMNVECQEQMMKQ